MSQRLVPRVTISFLAAVLPLSVGPVYAFFWSDQVMEETLQERLDHTVSTVRGQLDQEKQRLSTSVQGFLQSDALEDLARDPQTAVLAVPPGVDIFEVARFRSDGTSEIIYSLHLPVAVWDPAGPWAPRALKEPSGRGYGRVLVRGNPPEAKPALWAWGSAQTQSGPVAVRAGLRLDSGFLSRWTQGAGARAKLTEGGQTVLASPPAGDFEPGEPMGRRAHLDLSTVDGPPARIELWVPAGPWAQVRGRILWTGTLGLAGSAVAALAVGLAFSRSVSRPVVALSRAAARVAEGDLTAQVSFRGQGELGQLGLDFNDMTRQLASQRERLRQAERVAAWREVARRVAHEVKNPLFPIRLAAETIRKGFKRGHPDLDALIERSTQTILREVASIDRLVSEFTRFARMPAAQPQWVPLSRVLAPLHGEYGGASRPPEVEAPLTEATPVWADPQQLQQVLHNLFQNALEAGASRVGVRVQAPDSGGFALIVEDDGPGLPDREAGGSERIFEPYYTTKPSGTGLGLAIVERVVEDHRGQINLVPSRWGGAGFRLRFPPGPAPGPPAAASKPAGPTATAPGGEEGNRSAPTIPPPPTGPDPRLP